MVRIAWRGFKVECASFGLCGTLDSAGLPPPLTLLRLLAMSAIFNSIDTAQRSQKGTGAAGEATGRGQSRRGTGSGEDEEGEGASRGRGKGQRAPLAKQACVRCRTIKVRCQPQEPGNGRCVRCTRLKFDCEWVEPQKRGRRVGSSRCV